MEVDQTNLPEKIKPMGAGIQGPDFNVDLLKIYYDKAFPCDLMYKWLSYFKFRDPASSGMLQSLKDEDTVKSE